MEGERKKFDKKLISNCIFLRNVTFIKTSNPALCRQKQFVLNLTDCTQMTLSHQSFSSQSLRSLFWRFLLTNVR